MRMDWFTGRTGIKCRCQRNDLLHDLELCSVFDVCSLLRCVRDCVSGLTPLHLAVKLNRVGLVEMLIAAGANVNVADGKSGHTPLHLAAESGQLDVVELLLAKRADVQLASYYGCTAMQSASARAHNKIVKLLVEHGAETLPEHRVLHLTALHCTALHCTALHCL